MRVRELHEAVASPTRSAPLADEDAWCSLVDALVPAVREQERKNTLGVLNRLVIAARALPTCEAVARLIAGVATRDYGTPAVALMNARGEA
jgi:hypothetical protein